MSDKRLTIFNSITFKVLFIVVSIILIGIGVTIAYYLNSQNATIIETKENEIRQEANIIYMAIKNNMLPGEAPIAVELFRDFTRSNFASMIKLYRSDGVIAFSDNGTVDAVNKNLKREKFSPKKIFIPYEKNNEPGFRNTIAAINDTFVRDIGEERKNLNIYKILFNQPKCSRCHGLDHVVRGVLKISTPVDEVYMKTRENIYRYLRTCRGNSDLCDHFIHQIGHYFKGFGHWQCRKKGG
jgi:adenylate cyclase